MAAKEGFIESSGFCYFHHEWKVKNFSSLKEEFYSREFEVELFGDLTKWVIPFYPHEAVENSDNIFCGIYLELNHTHLIHLLVDCKFTLFNSDRIEIENRSLRKTEYQKGSRWGFRKFIERDLLLKKISKDDNLWISSEITVSWNPLRKSKSLIIVQDIDKIRASGDFSDVTFSVKNKKFPAHKAILAARSPVFSAMFKTEMKEAISGEVEIEDMTPEVFEVFLKYIYGGDAAFTDRFIAGDLLAAADKYDIEDLKDSCEEFLIRELSSKNCINILILANFHSAENLKRKTLDFIISMSPKLDTNLLSDIDDDNLMKELVVGLFGKHVNIMNELVVDLIKKLKV